MINVIIYLSIFALKVPSVADINDNVDRLIDSTRGGDNSKELRRNKYLTYCPARLFLIFILLSLKFLRNDL